MKHLVLVGDGMADFPLAELGDRTPLEVAATPAMDEVVRRGLLGLFCPIPDDLAPGSDIGNLSLFGYDPRTTYTGRAPLEAARQGIILRDKDVAFRCNLVTLRDGVMASFTGGQISTEEARRLVEAMDEVAQDLPARFHTGIGYRHLTIVTAGTVSTEDLLKTECTPPHDITDRPFAGFMPSGPASGFLYELFRRSHAILESHPVNVARAAAGKLPANSIWLWGQGRSPTMQTYRERFGLRGAVISAVNLVNGIGVCAGLEVIHISGATGYLDTNYEGKVAGALEGLERCDFVYLHVEAPDETGHEGRIDLKIQAIQDFDRRVVAPCLEHAVRRGDCRILVAPDHVTAIETRTHAGGPVPFAMCGPGILPDASTLYSERAASGTGLLVRRGHALVPCFLRAPSLSHETLARIDEASESEYA